MSEETKPKSGRGGNRDKGPDFERKCCARLSLWVTNLQREDVFWRTSISGGRATFRSRRVDANNAVRDRLVDNQAGDITAIHPSGQVLLDLFVVECKFWRDMTFSNLVFAGRGRITAEWEKLRDSCRRRGRAMMFVAKQNRLGEACCVDADGRDILLKGVDNPQHLALHATFPQMNPPMFVYQFRDIITDVTFDALRAYHTELYGPSGRSDEQLLRDEVPRVKIKIPKPIERVKIVVP